VNIKIIAILRDPIERLVSAWIMYHYHFKDSIHKYFYDPRPLERVINDCLAHHQSYNFYKDRRGYLQRGLYLEQLNRYYNYFDKNNILLIDHVDLKYNHDSTLLKIYNFLEVESILIPQIKCNSSKIFIESNTLDNIKQLKSFYYRPNYDLALLTGIKFE